MRGTEFISDGHLSLKYEESQKSFNSDQHTPTTLTEENKVPWIEWANGKLCYDDGMFHEKEALIQFHSRNIKSSLVPIYTHTYEPNEILFHGTQVQDIRAICSTFRLGSWCVRTWSTTFMYVDGWLAGCLLAWVSVCVCVREWINEDFAVCTVDESSKEKSRDIWALFNPLKTWKWSVQSSNYDKISLFGTDLAA